MSKHYAIESRKAGEAWAADVLAGWNKLASAQARITKLVTGQTKEGADVGEPDLQAIECGVAMIASETDPAKRKSKLAITRTQIHRACDANKVPRISFKYDERTGTVTCKRAPKRQQSRASAEKSCVKSLDKVVDLLYRADVPADDAARFVAEYVASRYAELDD